MIKILQVFSSLDVGGAEGRMMDVYRNIDRTKYSFDFVKMTKKHTFYDDEIKKMGGIIYEIDRPEITRIFFHIRQLRLCMRAGNYDVVHAHTLYHCGIAMLAAYLEHIPVRIAHARNTEASHTNRKSRTLERIGKFLIKIYATDKIAISRAAGDYLFGKSDYKIIANTIQFDNYIVHDPCRLIGLRQEIGITANDIVIGQIGHLYVQKNHKFTIEWFSQYLKHHDNARLLLIGEGELFAAIEARLNELNIHERVKLLGTRHDIPALLSCMNVMIFPSLYEGLGGVVLEAQAAGIPVVISNRIPEEAIVVDSMVAKCSLEAPFRDWNNAIDAMLKVNVPDVETRKECFETKGYDIKAVTERYETIYEKANDKNHI